MELTFQPRESVAQLAQADGVNSNQVFQRRCAYRNGELELGDGSSATLLPVSLSSQCASSLAADERAGQAAEVQVTTGEQTAAPITAIHIELPGRALISVDSGADPILVRTIRESLLK